MCDIDAAKFFESLRLVAGKFIFLFMDGCYLYSLMVKLFCLRENIIIENKSDQLACATDNTYSPPL